MARQRDEPRLGRPRARPEDARARRGLPALDRLRRRPALPARRDRLRDDQARRRRGRRVAGHHLPRPRHQRLLPVPAVRQHADGHRGPRRRQAAPDRHDHRARAGRRRRRRGDAGGALPDPPPPRGRQVHAQPRRPTTSAGWAGCASCRPRSEASSARRSSLRTMDDGTLRERLWQGFAQLQTLLGGEAAGGVVVEEHGVVASFVPGAPDSPTLNAAIVVARRARPRAAGRDARALGAARRAPLGRSGPTAPSTASPTRCAPRACA